MRNKIPLLILLFNFSNFFGQTPEAVLKDHPQILVNLAEPLKSLSPTPCFAERDKNTDENFKKQPLSFPNDKPKRGKKNRIKRGHKRHATSEKIANNSPHDSFIINSTHEPPKREFRGVWVATVANIDWPSKGNLNTELQKQELVQLLDEHQKSGINAIMLQIRPAADAFYGKSRELWSRYLTGTQGKAPSPYYDPLAFAIKEAHERGMELHAWFNPYRATFDLIDANTNEKHITKQKPDWFFTYDGKKLFNPGIPEVQSYIIDVIMDVVRNYDIDGVHFDDYFYPYPKETYPQKSLFLVDENTYKKYNSHFDSIEDWRRHNVDTLIQRLSDSIHTAKKYIKFGISPFGIWRNISQDPNGSESNGFDGYSRLYADARKWAQMGWIDYINPQIYFPFYYKAAPYEKLVDWWSKNAFNRHLYIGLAAYRAAEKRGGWLDPQQIPNQIRYLRNNPNVTGSVFFSSKSLIKNLAGLNTALRDDFYKYPALTPTMPWLDNIPPNPPQSLQVELDVKEGVPVLKWAPPSKAIDNELAYGYVIYRFNDDATVNTNTPKNILKISFESAQTSFIDTTALPNHRYHYTVTALDRMKNESTVSNVVSIKISRGK